MTVRESKVPMIIIVNGKPVRLSPEDAAERKWLLRDATAAVVARYRPALERLEKA